MKYHEYFHILILIFFAQECKSLNISFHLLVGYAKDVLPKFMKDNKIGGLVTDFSPLRTPLEWVDSMKKKINVPFCQVVN